MTCAARLAFAVALLGRLAHAQESSLQEEALRHVRDLGAPDSARRDAAEDSLVALGDPVLGLLPGAADPEIAWRLARVERRILWRIDRALDEQVGGILDGFEGRPFRERVARLHEVARLGGSLALPTLIAVAEGDPHPEVRRHARRLAGEIDLELRVREAQDALAERRFDDAIQILSASLEVDPEGPSIHYQLACWYSLAGRLDEAFESLEHAIERGFTNFEHMKEDPELSAVRADPRFSDLRTRHEDRNR